MRKLKGGSFYLKIALAFPVYLIVRIISPVILIRFGPLQSYRIGHFAGNIEMYLCEKYHGIQPKNSIDFFFINPKYNYFVCNNQLLKMWKRVLRVHQMAYYLYWINAQMPDGKKHIAKSTNADRDVFRLLEKSPVSLYFTQKEESLGIKGLEKMGIKEGSRFVCLANRDPSYLQNIFPGRDYSYHSYRNSNIQNYILASEWLAEKEFFVIRVGQVVKEAMRTNSPMIIEYARRGFRSDFLDIYLGANCFFFISNGTGIDAIPYIFRKPVLYVNYNILKNPMHWNSKSITIFKKYWLKKEQRFMTFKELLETKVDEFSYAHKHEEFGVELKENTDEEIKDAVMEMEERLNGTWQSSDEDEDLQNRYWSLFLKPIETKNEFPSRIGAKYLRDNRELLN